MSSRQKIAPKARGPRDRREPPYRQNSGRTATINLESSYDWIGETWNVPLNLQYSKVTKWGSQMVSYQGGVRYFIETPGEGPEWGFRLVLTLLFPGG